MQAADAPAAASSSSDSSNKDKYGVNPDEPEISPSVVPWKSYKNDYYTKRGFKLGSKESALTGWEDLPEGPFKHLGVKVNPDHVLQHGPVWSFFSDWRTAIPGALMLSLPLWMFNVLPGLDERMELALITVSAGWVAIKVGGPLARGFKRSRVATRVKALLQHESELNAEISEAIDAYGAGSNVVSYARAVNNAERALKALEAEAATKRVKSAARDALVSQLDYLVSLQASGAGAAEAEVLKAARSTVESSFEKDAKLQQASVDAAIKALTTGSSAASDDVVSPLFTKALESARKDNAAKPAAKPFANPQLVDIFRKRFGLSEFLSDACEP